MAAMQFFRRASRQVGQIRSQLHDRFISPVGVYYMDYMDCISTGFLGFLLVRWLGTPNTGPMGPK